MSVLASEADVERNAFFCKRVPRTGCLVLDKAKLAAVVKAEGLSFVDATDVDLKVDSHSLLNGRDFSKPVVFSLNVSQMDEDNHCSTNPNVIGWLVRVEESRSFKRTLIEVYSSQLQIAKWLRDGADRECIVCYKLVTGEKLLEDNGLVCGCGTVLCFGCSIDLLMIAPTEMSTECPICRRELDARRNLHMIIKILFDTVSRATQIVGTSDEHLDFIEKMTGVDLRLSHERATTQAKRLHCAYDQITSKVIKLKKGDAHIFTPESSMRLYTAVREYIESKRKKKVVSACADDSRSSVLVARRGCANCGKQFWDKSDWRRALKCAKCQRTAYCSAKCRKKHAKAHTAECSSAKGAKLKRKPKKKKPKKKKPKKREGGCAPY